jgi:hypothetical protein
VRDLVAFLGAVEAPKVLCGGSGAWPEIEESERKWDAKAVKARKEARREKKRIKAADDAAASTPTIAMKNDEAAKHGLALSVSASASKAPKRAHSPSASTSPINVDTDDDDDVPTRVTRPRRAWSAWLHRHPCSRCGRRPRREAPAAAVRTADSRPARAQRAGASARVAAAAAAAAERVRGRPEGAHGARRWALGRGRVAIRVGERAAFPCAAAHHLRIGLRYTEYDSQKRICVFI